MTYLSKTLLVFVVLLLSFSERSFGNLSNTVDSVNNDTIKSKGLDLILVGGLGIAYSNAYWSEHFNTSPSLQIGLELPFKNSSQNSFEILFCSWVAKMRPNSYYDPELYYNNIGKDMYSQIGLTAVIRNYLNSDTSKVRLSIHYGLHFLAMDYLGIDLGLALEYKINNKLKLQLAKRFIIDFLLNNMFIGIMGEKITPNLLMLNICYNFKW